ncbi:hypothetical protein HPP92_012858 [Vanilla planifolia]|uniref:Rho termination factor-like N-terminal domain-containing protein n=1 Tax=Vanilla planifolia TaxID=51239 RepID=A0A835UVX7_VANPL|nr:hypothetical protein HPP92_012858 [Vanilla planifolia]
MILDWKLLPCQGAHGGTIISSTSSINSQKLFLGANFSTKHPISCHPRSLSICRATTNKRNVYFSRQYKVSPSKTRENHEIGNPENLEGNPPHKNGPTSPSTNDDRRYSVTSSPGQREKEIVELFKRVQAQLRVRAGPKEEKRVDVAREGSVEQPTVDSLLQLLRKHSLAQGKKTTTGNGLHPNHPNHPETPNSLDEPQMVDRFEEEGDAIFVEPEPTVVPLSRPVSSFKRRSPIPRVKFQPIFSSDEAIGSSLKTQKKIDGVNSEANAKLEPEPLQELDLELEPVEESSETKLEPLDDESSRNASDCDEAKVGSSEASVVMQSTDLSSWKVSELRALAKTRGIRRYSKLKKNELLELLIIDKA